MAELNPYVTCVTASDALGLILTAGVYHPPPLRGAEGPPNIGGLVGWEPLLSGSHPCLMNLFPSRLYFLTQACARRPCYVGWVLHSLL